MIGKKYLETGFKRPVYKFDLIYYTDCFVSISFYLDFYINLEPLKKSFYDFMKSPQHMLRDQPGKRRN